MKKILSALLIVTFILSSFVLTACQDYEIPEDIESSEGLELKKIWGGYKVIGIGTCKDAEIVIPDKVIEIDSFAFKDCTQIKKIAIPKTVKEIGQQAFYGCSNLQEVYIDKGVEKLGAMLFYMSDVNLIAFNGTAAEFKKIKGGKNLNAWYYVGMDYGYKEFYVYCTDVILVYNFKDGNDTPKIKEYEKEDETKTHYIPVKAVLDSSRGTCSVVIDFGENGLPSKETQTRFGELDALTEYIYDSKNQLIKSIFKGSDGKQTGSSEYTYDSKGNFKQSILKDSDGSVTTIFNNIFDENGQIIEMWYMDGDGTVIGKYEYIIDSNGNLIKEVYSDETTEEETLYTYDSNGKLIERIQGDFKYTYTYDSKGNIIKVVAPDFYNYENYGKYITYNITNDANGNITKITATDASNKKITCTFEYKKVTVSKNVKVNESIETMFTQLRFMDTRPEVIPVFPNGDSTIVPKD